MKKIIFPESRLEVLSEVGSYSFVCGWLLIGLAFLTDRSPLPYYPHLSFPWQLPWSQPSLGPYPASFTIGAWLTDISLPLVILKFYISMNPATTFRSSLILTGGVGFWLLVCNLYCRFFWPHPQPAFLFEPDIAFVCWKYCTTYSAGWSNFTLSVVALSLSALWFVKFKPTAAPFILSLLGVVAFPVGIPAFFNAYIIGQSENPLGKFITHLSHLKIAFLGNFG